MNILVAYDGSDSAMRALDQAATLAERGASVSVLSVGKPLRTLIQAKTTLAAKGIAASILVRKGDTASRIIDEATTEQADVIVMGTRGHRGPLRWLLGSVSERVLRHAPCDVVVVP